jgi:predicted RNA-binding Zn ribbon-like protein
MEVNRTIVAMRSGTKEHGSDDLLRWSRAAGVLAADRVTALKTAARKSPTAARGAFRSAIELRELIYRVCEALMSGKRLAESDVKLLNRFVSRFLNRAEFRWTSDGLTWKSQRPAPDLMAMLEAIVRAATQLFTSESAGKISQCQDDRGCGFVFLDKSRSKKRQWCSMSDCGNRAKVRRHYLRSSSKA